MRVFTASRLIFIIFLVFSSIFFIMGYKYILDKWPSFVSFFLLWVTTFLKMLYDSWERFYLILNKIKAILLNKATTWEICVEYSLDNMGLLDNATASIKEVFPSLKYRENNIYQKTIQAGKYTVFLKESPEIDENLIGLEGTARFNVDIGAITIPFRQVEKILEQEIIPLLNKLERKISPKFCKYTFIINYDGENPFYGLYIRRLPAGIISNFKCDIIEKFADESVFITIEVKKVIIIASNPSNLLSVSRKYLLMSTSR